MCVYISYMLYVYVMYQHMPRTRTKLRCNQHRTRGPRCTSSVMHHVVRYCYLFPRAYLARAFAGRAEHR